VVAVRCPHNFLPPGGRYPLCGVDGVICFGPDQHCWDACPVYFGEWGAWRSFVGAVDGLWFVVIGGIDRYGYPRDVQYVPTQTLYDAVGWSPWSAEGATGGDAE
jgi:hypothetical protein